MEKVRCICVMRDIVSAMSELENRIIDDLGLTLNEAMTLCAIGEHSVAASVVAERTGMRASHCSKIISALERRKLVCRSIDKYDKRHINMTLTRAGKESLNALKDYKIVVPEILEPVFANYDDASK
ncbi:MAG: MarR family transcriptional regulator [Alistipes sp.]|nr:MarR family transcriptional regulator [Alistipes sp.]